ncbi:DEBR0S4_08174g1_1 [Brettanomyces bruxellensis]|uniref:DEBR0S4_08174g1_1 n=1 Tax=Dekkera bruxellensis TaxID=5007 RepID=A0A7D9H2E2_DEKBR|nr:DEBR0S4_08174g1_1 [Brettanomyces bruxellensis]
MSLFRRKAELPIIQVKNLPYNVKASDLYDLFGRFGNVHQVRIGTDNNTRGQAYIIYKNHKSSVLALKKLEGFNFNGRYLVVRQFIPDGGVMAKLRKEVKKEAQAENKEKS